MIYFVKENRWGKQWRSLLYWAIVVEIVRKDGFIWGMVVLIGWVWLRVSIILLPDMIQLFLLTTFFLFLFIMILLHIQIAILTFKLLPLAIPILPVFHFHINFRKRLKISFLVNRTKKLAIGRRFNRNGTKINTFNKHILFTTLALPTIYL